MEDSIREMEEKAQASTTTYRIYEKELASIKKMMKKKGIKVSRIERQLETLNDQIEELQIKEKKLVMKVEKGIQKIEKRRR